MSKLPKARLGLIGAGWWATSNHLPLLAARDDVELVGVCRLGHKELKQVQEAFGDYQLGNYDVRAKPRLIIVARKNSK